MVILSNEIEKALEKNGFNMTASEGRLMLAELLLKAGAGFYNSSTEESYAQDFGMLKSDRTPNKKGARFLCSIFYKHSNLHAPCFKLIQKHRLEV